MKFKSLEELFIIAIILLLLCIKPKEENKNEKYRYCEKA